MAMLFMTIVQVFITTLFGPLCLFLLAYLLKKKKLPYDLEKTVKPEMKEQYLRIEIIYYASLFIIFVSFSVWLSLIESHNILVYGLHAIPLLGVCFWRVYKKKNIYLYT